MKRYQLHLTDGQYSLLARLAKARGGVLNWKTLSERERRIFTELTRIVWISADGSEEPLVLSGRAYNLHILRGGREALAELEP